MILRPYQKESLRGFRKKRKGLKLWARQKGKTTDFAWDALGNMARHKGCLCTLVSASINVGGEVTEREAKLFSSVVDGMKADAASKGLMLETSGDKMRWDDYLDLFSKSKLEVRLWHSKTLASRTKIIAPNAATARGYSGFVYMDEIGFIRDLRDLYEAMEPIFSSDPTFRLMMATTLPSDDSHFSYELCMPDPAQRFDVNPLGNWYTAQSGLLVHRLDAYDAAAAGIVPYDDDGQAITPAQHRALSMDKDAWDRNYGLLFKVGGTAAIGLLTIQSAQERGSAMQCLAAEDDLPSDWWANIGDGQVCVGLDPATTENKLSNPTGLAITEKVGNLYVQRLALRFKTADDRKQKALLTEIFSELQAHSKRLRRLLIDATSERFFAAQVKREFQGYCPVELVVASEATTYAGQKMTMKQYLGNLMVNAFEDNLCAIPSVRWVKDDFRAVKRTKGSFDNEVDSAGNHGDVADAFKLTLHGHISRGGPCEAEAIRMTSSAGADSAGDRTRLHMRRQNQDDNIQTERLPA